MQHLLPVELESWILWFWRILVVDLVWQYQFHLWWNTPWRIRTEKFWRNVNLSQNLSEHFLWWNDIVVTSWVGLTQKTEILTENSGARGAGILHKWRRYSFLEFLQLKCWFMCIDEVFWCNPTSFKAMGLVHFEKRRQKSARYWKKRRRSGFLALSGQKYKKKCTKYVYEHNPNSADNIGLVLY